MSKRKQRFLQNLYHSTPQIIPPQITPELKRSCQIQGPVDEIEPDFKTNTVPLQIDEGFSRLSKSQKVPVTAEFGACNVCSAPCSSCLHVAGALMQSKTKEFSDEPYRENTLSYSVDDVATTVKRRRSKIGQHATSETSNLMNSDSSHDSFTENAQSKALLRTSDVSGASGNVESSGKLSSGETLGDDDHSLRSESLKNKNYSAIKFDDPRGLEGHDDNISSVNGAEYANKSSISVIQTERINLPSSASVDSLVVESHGKGVLFQTPSDSPEIKFDVEGSINNSCRQSRCNEEPLKKVSPGICTSSELSSHSSELMGNHSDKLEDNGIVAQDLRSASHTPCGEFISGTLTSKELVEDSCSHLKGKPECSTREHLSSLVKTDDICDIQKPASFISDDIQNNKVGFDDEKLEIGTRNDVGDLPDEALNCEEQSREVEKVGDFSSLPEAKTTSFQSHHVDESDESDIVEHDVKVCDICGDAGREDLLAICCQCSDGAEHTYCMRERLDKVPEGDWLCEECKSTEEVDSRRQDKSGTEDRAEKDLPSGQEDTEIATVRAKLDAKVSDVEGNRPNKGPSYAKSRGKRPADDTEVSTAAKRQALEPVVASPKAAHPSRVRSLSRDSSFKNLDSGKVKPTPQLSSGMHFPSDTSEAARSPTTGPRLQSTGGGFLKSNSFNFSNAKSKVKLVDEVPHKHRSSKEAASRDVKEGAVRGIGKSLSFRSINSARLSTGESKVKMLSPNFSHVQDHKGSKQTNEKNFYERKNSFRSPRSSINPTTSGSTISLPKGDQKFTTRGESVSLSSTSNADLKTVQSDSRLVSATKPLNHGSRRAAEGPTSTGELKRQLSCLPSVAGAPSSTSLVEQKAIEASMKDESLANSLTGDDELPRARESTHLSERIKESSTSHPRQSVDAGANCVPCQKCKEIGHSAQFCTVDSHRSLGFDSSVPKYTKEEINKGSKLKAALEAAMLKKPSIYRKNRIPSQTDEISVSSMNNESASQDQLSSSSSMRSMNSLEVIEGKAIRNSDANSKLTNGADAKQLMVIPGEALSPSSGDGSSMVPSDGKQANVELPSHAAVAMSLLLQMSAIPDHEYIWQGSFDVHRGRKTPELWDGLQAHLSTWASPKVIAAANKFPRRVLLNEVPRLSAWPIQFEESGVREDNIALYFFARDYESYERSYKILLERMMRSDLALRGNIDGVELLIFPSNQLPEKSQRWNMLYFFWGVFRGKKESCLPQGPVSSKKFCIPPDMPDAIVALPENVCSLGSTEKISPMPDRANLVVTTAPALVELPSFSSVETKNMEQQDCNPNPSSSSSAQIRLDESSPTMSADINSDSKADREPQVSLESASAACGSNTTMSEKVACNLSFPADRQQASANNSNKVPTGVEEMASFPCTSQGNVAVENRMDGSQDDVKGSKNRGPEEGSLGVEAALEKEMVMGVQMTREVNSCPLDSRKRTFVGPAEKISEVTYAGTSQTKLWDDVNNPLADGANTSKKQKTGPFEWNNPNASFVRDDFASRMRDGALSLSIKEEKLLNTPSEETAIPISSENNGERFFFPVDPPRQVKGDNLIPWRGSLRSEIEDKLPKRTPNLELALGGELKSFRVGNLDINLDEEPPDEEEVEVELKSSRVGKLDINLDEEPPDEEEVEVELKSSRVGKLDINLDEVPPEEEEEEEEQALSLSLSFPMAERDTSVPAVARAEQAMPGNQHVNPAWSFLETSQTSRRSG